MPRGRERQTPRDAKIDSEKRILESLTNGKKTYNQLLGETKLSEPTLAARLKELEKKHKIMCETNPDDRRSKLYSLTPKGISDLQKKWLIRDVGLTPLSFNYNTNLYLESKYGDSRIGIISALQERGSKVYEHFSKEIYSQLKDIMRKKYPDENLKTLERKCARISEWFFDELEVTFSLTFFSSLKMPMPGKSKWRSLAFEPLIPHVKYDYYANFCIDFFERMLKILYDTFKDQYNSNLQNFLDSMRPTKRAKNKMIIVADLDIGYVASKMDELEWSFFAKFAPWVCESLFVKSKGKTQSQLEIISTQKEMKHFDSSILKSLGVTKQEEIDKTKELFEARIILTECKLAFGQFGRGFSSSPALEITLDAFEKLMLQLIEAYLAVHELMPMAESTSEEDVANIKNSIKENVLKRLENNVVNDIPQELFDSGCLSKPRGTSKSWRGNLSELLDEYPFTEASREKYIKKKLAKKEKH